MSFETKKKNGVVILTVNQGRLDSDLSAELKTEILILVEQEIKNVLIDLSNVAYVDSSGLGALLFGLRQLRELRGTLKIVGANSRITSLIRIAKLEQVLLNFEDEETALQSFQ